MKPFLYKIAERFYNEYGTEITQFAFVFPNRRAGLFFQKYLSEIADRPLFSPTILTINDLFVKLSGKQSADRIRMLFTLYDVYIEKSRSSETFDEFLYWGEMLLNDFDDIDKYLVDARKLFSNVTDLHEIEKDFDFLTPEQIAAIRSFWSSFYPKGDSPNQKEFLALWEILYDLYSELKARLSADGMGYEGMIFREVVESMKNGNDVSDFNYRQIIFVGLNALSAVEIEFLKELQKRDMADFYWDYEAPYSTDQDNKASFFALHNLRQFPSKFKIEKEQPVENQKIRTIGVPSGIGQTKQVYHLLKELSEQNLNDKEEALRTAIVLPDEALLIPLLNAIPEEIRHINVTMGYPLAGTPVASLMDYILALQKNVRYSDSKPIYYFRDVLPILNHRYISMAEPSAASLLVKEITANNRIYIAAGELGRTPFLSLLFTPVNNIEEFSEYLIKVLEELNSLLTIEESDDDDNSPKHSTEIEQEFIFHYFATINRMKEVMKESAVDMRMETFFRLVKRITDSITIPFHGEPLSGLQIMGVLETRALDFDRIILLSMNEGIFPVKKTANSFIPYNLRRGFGLPTYEHQDSVWAYHFYRLIYRAKEVTLLYDTRSNGLQTGEKSRYIHQLHYHYNLPVENELVVYDVVSGDDSVLEISKNTSVISLLDEFRKGGKRAISASAINTYLDCPLKFYFSILENIQDEEKVSESIETNVFGSILHKVMEILYKPFCGKMVTSDLLSLIKKNQKAMSEAIEIAFSEIFFKSDKRQTLIGQNYLIGEMIRKYVMKVLEHDDKLTPFQYIESEKKVNTDFTLSDNSVVQLKGFIDRIDEVKDTVRIVDYKSGSGTNAFSSVSSLFDSEIQNRPKAVMQVFMYSWMYTKMKDIYKGGAISPQIYYMRTLFGEKFNSSVLFERKEVNNFGEFSEEFEQELRMCLDRIFDSSTSFTQTNDIKTCSYCSFRSICGR